MDNFDTLAATIANTLATRNLDGSDDSHPALAAALRACGATCSIDSNAITVSLSCAADQDGFEDALYGELGRHADLSWDVIDFDGGTDLHVWIDAADWNRCNDEG